MNTTSARRFAGHPNVVQVHDVFEVDLPEHGRCVALVHELAEESLDHRLRRTGRSMPVSWPAWPARW